MSIHKRQQFHLTTVDFWPKTLLFRTKQVRNSMTQLTLTCMHIVYYDFTTTKVIIFILFSVVPWRLLKWCHVSKISISKISFNWSPNTGSKSKGKIQAMNSFTLSIWKKLLHAKRSHQSSSLNHVFIRNDNKELMDDFRCCKLSRK